jgi:hypothetical protein
MSQPLTRTTGRARRPYSNQRADELRGRRHRTPPGRVLVQQILGQPVHHRRRHQHLPYNPGCLTPPRQTLRIRRRHQRTTPRTHRETPPTTLRRLPTTTRLRLRRQPTRRPKRRLNQRSHNTSRDQPMWPLCNSARAASASPGMGKPARELVTRSLIATHHRRHTRPHRRLRRASPGRGRPRVDGSDLALEVLRSRGFSEEVARKWLQRHPPEKAVDAWP